MPQCTQVFIADHSIVHIGDMVETKVGIGIIEKIDNWTYSIPFCVIQLIKGKYKNEKVYISASELRQVRI